LIAFSFGSIKVAVMDLVLVRSGTLYALPISPRIEGPFGSEATQTPVPSAQQRAGIVAALLVCAILIWGQFVLMPRQPVAVEPTSTSQETLQLSQEPPPSFSLDPMVESNQHRKSTSNN
jgi:hypothetical protein